MPRKKQNDVEQPELIAQEAAEYIVSPDEEALREFNEYRRSKGRLKIFRGEAVRAGFSHAWREREYDVIVEIAERMPESVLQEDQQLLMYYHNAGLRRSSQPKQEDLL